MKFILILLLSMVVSGDLNRQCHTDMECESMFGADTDYED